MARQLKWWMAGTMLACVGLALLYLPPRAGAGWRDMRRIRVETASPFRLRERDLAYQLRDVEAALRLFELRAQLGPELAQRRARGIPGPVVRIEGSHTPSDSIRHLLATELDTMWRRLGLGVTKIGVGVALDIRTGQPSAHRALYLLPDSSDRTSCMVLLPAVSWRRTLLADTLPNPIDRFRAWLRNGLGPCAFYAAYGNPGREVARWLSARNFDLALSPQWESVDQDEQQSWSSSLDQTHNRWFWLNAYRLRPSAIGCLAGRSSSCRAAVLDQAVDSDSVRHLVAIDRWREQALVGGDRYLADVRQAVGADRFRAFWNSELPVDTALAAVLGTPVGQWTRRWEAHMAPAIRLGPAAPVTAELFGLLLALGAVAWVTRAVARREVR